MFRFCIIHEVCLAHILTAVFPIGSDTSLPHVCEASYVGDQADYIRTLNHKLHSNALGKELRSYNMDYSI